jgi:diguanylate cyclase (GGDEF)-like protein/PAS domain S-box-containing protein
MSQPLRVLLAEDVPTDAELESRALQRAGIDCIVQRVDTKEQFLAMIGEFRPDVILSDFSLPGFDGLTALAIARERRPDTPFIFVSGTIGEELAIESLKRGATDYILKANLVRLGPAVRRALQDAQERLARQAVERQLREARERFELFMRHLPGAAFIKDLEGRYQFVNQTWERVTGKTAEAAVGRTDHELWPQLAGQFQQNDRAVLETGEIVQAFETFPQSDGIHTFMVHRFPIRSDEGQPLLLGGISVDFTERLHQEEKIARLSRIQRVLSDINSIIVRVHDRGELFREACRVAVEDGGFRLAWVGLLDRQTLDVRPSVWRGEEGGFLRSLRLSARADVPQGRGVSGTAIRGRKPVVVNDVASDDRLVHRAETLRHGFRSFVVLPLMTGSEPVGALYLYTGETGYFDQDELKLLVELAGDISFALAYIEKEEKLNYLAYYDALTGLSNRHLFHEHVGQYLQSAHAEGGKVGLLVLDLLRFGIINDTFGRSAGDALLQEVADRLAKAMQESSQLARISADTFAVAVPAVKDEAQIAHVLEQILGTMNRPFTIEGQELAITVKCGLALSPGDGADAETLFRNAEAALKNAKDSREKYLFYAPQMNARVAERLALENRLRTAILEQQLVLYYQPKINLVTGKISGLEALLRWVSPDRGVIPPAEFIPILEETGMILEVGRQALTRAAADHAGWRGMGLQPPRVAVNVSAVQLHQKDFVDDVRIAVKSGGESGGYIDLEITESMIMDDIEGNIRKLAEIRAMGVGISLDDFGTGYSSLSHIAKLPVDSLKIDRTFIAAMVDSSEHMAIVTVVISLARALNLKVIAEGVETKEQANLLRLLRCDEMQGYLISAPLPPEQVERLLRDNG